MQSLQYHTESFDEENTSIINIQLYSNKAYISEDSHN